MSRGLRLIHPRAARRVTDGHWRRPPVLLRTGGNSLITFRSCEHCRAYYHRFRMLYVLRTYVSEYGARRGDLVELKFKPNPQATATADGRGPNFAFGLSPAN